jgi:hypothetical protein
MNPVSADHSVAKGMRAGSCRRSARFLVPHLPKWVESRATGAPRQRILHDSIKASGSSGLPRGANRLCEEGEESVRRTRAWTHP